ncbi:hypothetical protein [Phyllobacterium zundukense]|uniref:hypothetical protein n=1 Tax=Phyllobacterium zundukense TaxID=1867719 RepID=UPI0013000182|nr:hypothetical protein [Phyllobacterium zundukense]
MKEGINAGIDGMHSAVAGDVQAAMPGTNLFFGYQRLAMFKLHFMRIFAKCPQLLGHYI